MLQKKHCFGHMSRQACSSRNREGYRFTKITFLQAFPQMPLLWSSKILYSFPENWPSNQTNHFLDFLPPKIGPKLPHYFLHR